jgi:hypothetical protein
MSVIQTAIKEKCGFITEAQLPAVIAEDRLQMIIVRCGNGRFVCPAQDVAHFIAIIEKEGSDYIRDVSIYTPSIIKPPSCTNNCPIHCNH